MRSMNYILEGKEVKQVSFFEWVEWMNLHGTERIVKKTSINGIEVSTVFLGVASNLIFHEGEPPMVFETMIFGGRHNLFKKNHCTWQEAEAFHEVACEMVRKELN